jgi:bacillithiol biosynthesis cysteine-adding enzyme BshC
MRETLGIGYESGAVVDLFEKAYLRHKTVADATRFLVDKLFGSLGVLVIDGDDAELKRLMIPYFQKELKEQVSYRAMKETNSALAGQYKLQVEPREINLFYLEKELRERIIRTEKGDFEVIHTDIHFDVREMEKELREHPERFSPNVTLRPLYQEVILPNLAYIGGGGELNYWFQLKGVFEAFEVPFPILMLRNSVLVIDEPTSERMAGLGLRLEDLFKNSGIELEKELVREVSAEELDLEKEIEELEALFLRMEAKLRKVDKLLERSVRSGFVRTERIVMNLEKKMLRAERKKHEIITGRLHKVREAILPREGLQERNLNFAVLYLWMGEALIPTLLEHLDPFEGKFTVLRP